MAFFDRVKWLDYIFVCSFFVVFIFLAFRGRKTWSMIECSLSFIFGVGLILIPEIFMGFRLSDGILDDVDSFLSRHIGALLIGESISLFRYRNSFDTRMLAGVFYARLFTSTLLLLSQCYSAYDFTDSRFNEKLLAFSICVVFVRMLGSFVQLIRYQELGGYIQRYTYITVCLWIDHFALLLAGITLFALPAQILRVMTNQKTLDDVHVCFVRIIAALLIDHALSSNSACGFLYLKDQRSHVIGRITTHVLIFINNIFGHFVLNIFTIYHVIPFMTTGFYITFLLIFFFRFNEQRNAVSVKPSSRDDERSLDLNLTDAEPMCHVLESSADIQRRTSQSIDTVRSARLRKRKKEHA